jgi:hypothetical protein
MTARPLNYAGRPALCAVHKPHSTAQRREWEMKWQNSIATCTAIIQVSLWNKFHCGSHPLFWIINAALPQWHNITRWTGFINKWRLLKMHNCDTSQRTPNWSKWHIISIINNMAIYFSLNLCTIIAILLAYRGHGPLKSEQCLQFPYSPGLCATADRGTAQHDQDW